VVAVACTLLFFFPMIDYVDPVKGTYKLFATGMKSFAALQGFLFFWETFPLLILVIVSLLMALITIFFYKKRRLQVLLVSINVLLNVVIIALVFLLYSRIFENRLQIISEYQFGIYIPLISLVFLVLATRAIRKDEAMVKSSDRLR
jgi:membrane-bound acyltransferase YfiQ involved in biofilm formation